MTFLDPLDKKFEKFIYRVDLLKLINCYCFYWWKVKPLEFFSDTRAQFKIWCKLNFLCVWTETQYWKEKVYVETTHSLFLLCLSQRHRGIYFPCSKRIWQLYLNRLSLWVAEIGMVFPNDILTLLNLKILCALPSIHL